MGKLAEDVGYRLKELRIRAGLKQGELGAAAGISASQISRLESGIQWGHEDTFSALFAALGQALGISRATIRLEVLGGGNQSAGQNLELDDQKYVRVHAFDMQESVTGGRMLKEGRKPEGHVALLRHSVSQYTDGGDPELLLMVTVAGDSMSPTLNKGDVVLVDRAQAMVPEDALYVVRIQDALLVRRVQRLPGGKVRVTSDNQAYGAFEMSLENSAQDAEVGGPGGLGEQAGVIGRCHGLDGEFNRVRLWPEPARGMLHTGRGRGLPEPRQSGSRRHRQGP